MVNRMVLILVCFASIFGLCMFQVQAADVDANNKVVSVHLYVLFTSDEGGEFPLEQTVVLEGKDFRIYSFRQTDAVNGTFSSGCYVFSPEPFYVERYGVRSFFDTPFEVDGNVIYYCSIGGWSSSAKDEQYTNLSGFQNLNYCPGSPSDNAKKIAEEMARAGYYDYDDSGWVTDKLEPDTSGAKSADFSLADVKFWKDDSYFYASWSGLTEYFENEDISNDFISVSAGFYNSGISVSKSIGYFYLKDNSLKIPLSKLANYENDELSMIKLVPYHYAGSGHSELYKGKSSTTYFNDLFYDDEWGTYYDSECFIVNPKMSYTKGTSALSGTLSTFMGKELSNGMYSYSSRNMNYTFLWESVNTSIEADLSLSHMRIDIVCDNREYVFSNSGYLLSSGSIEISLQEILSLLQDNDVKPVIESFSIKYTPYYTIGRKTYHGQSVRFIVQANSAGILQISQGDDSFNENSDYSDVDIVPPDDLPIEIPGFTDDESFEFDFIYDSDNMFKNFFNSLKSLISYCGQIPFLVNKVFSFLPSIYGNMIVVILAACFVMRLLGR